MTKYKIVQGDAVTSQWVVVAEEPKGDKASDGGQKFDTKDKAQAEADRLNALTEEL